MELPFLEEIVTVFTLSSVVVLASHKLKIPTIVALLISGVLCGPSALGLVNDKEAVDIMAEVGVALLLFTIGMELSSKELVRIKRPLLIGGTSQVAMTVVLTSLLAFLMTKPPTIFVFGCLVTLSSTAIVLKLLQEKAQTESPHGRMCLAILIFQDLIIVPMMLIMPFLAGHLDLSFNHAVLAFTKAIIILVSIIFFGKYILPRLMLSVVRTRSRELMIMTTLCLCLAIALITASIGLSLALGAFLAGLLLAESEYSLNVLENILPFKEVFTSIFFISIGMLLNIEFFITHVLSIFAIAFAIIFIKVLVIIPAVRLTGYSSRTAIITALSLAQIGEFSFVLAGFALNLSLLDTNQYQLFLAASILTMTATPLFISIAPSVASKILRQSSQISSEEENESADEIKDHIVIVGFGIGGKNLAQVAKESGISYMISEMNPDTVKRYSGIEPIYHGDATFPLVLEHLHIRDARVLAIMVPDPVGARAIISHARRLNPSIHIVVRTRFLGEVETLRNIGANDIIPEEFETSIEVFARVLNYYLIPRQKIEQQIQLIREENYNMLRHVDMPELDTLSIRQTLPNLQFAAYEVEEASLLDGHSIGEGTLRNKYSVTVAGINRDGENIISIYPETSLQAQDIVYIFGTQKDIYEAQEAFKGKE